MFLLVIVKSQDCLLIFHDNYSFRTSENLRQPIQMHLCKKKETLDFSIVC